jgi:hypothetical protein
VLLEIGKFGLEQSESIKTPDEFLFFPKVKTEWPLAVPQPGCCGYFNLNNSSTAG